MSAPINTSALLAADIGILPANINQVVDDSGTTYTVWYKYTAQASDKVIGIWFFGDLVVYKTLIAVFTGPASAPVPYLGIGAVNKRLQFPVTPGETYYFRIRPNGGGNPSPANLTVSAENAPDSNIDYDGFIFCGEDDDGFAPCILNPTTAQIVRFLNPFSAGAGGQGDSLPDGTFLINFDYDGVIALYNSSITLITSFASSGLIRSCRGGDNFYLGNGGGGAVHASARSVSKLGVIGTTIGPLTSIGLTALAASNDQTILYYSGGTFPNSAIRRWNITGNVALTDLIAHIANYSVIDILILSDDSIVAMYFAYTPRDTKVIRYSAAGALLNTYSLGSHVLDHPGKLAYAVDEPNSFWAKIHPDNFVADENYTSKFFNIKVSDGSYLNTFNKVEYEDGVYSPLATAVPLAKFGPAKGGAFFILRNPSLLTYSWTKSSGPGDVVFSNPFELITTATFTCSGIYTLCLTACNACRCVTNCLQVTVLPDCDIPFDAIVFPGEGQGSAQHKCD